MMRRMVMMAVLLSACGPMPEREGPEDASDTYVRPTTDADVLCDELDEISARFRKWPARERPDNERACLQSSTKGKGIITDPCGKGWGLRRDGFEGWCSTEAYEAARAFVDCYKAAEAMPCERLPDDWKARDRAVEACKESLFTARFCDVDYNSSCDIVPQVTQWQWTRENECGE